MGVAGNYLNIELFYGVNFLFGSIATMIAVRMFGREATEQAELIDPRKVVTNALGLMGEQLRLSGIKVVTEIAEDCPSILGHTIQMEQVILNLLANARDAMAERDGEAKITLRVFEDDSEVGKGSNFIVTLPNV